MTDDKLLETVTELLPKVTQGEWHVLPHPNLSPKNFYQINEAGATRQCYRFRDHAGSEDENAALIALAPQMASRIISDAQLIAEQTEQIEALREGIENSLEQRDIYEANAELEIAMSEAEAIARGE